MESPPQTSHFRSRNSWITGEAFQTKTLCQCFHINRKATGLFISTRTFPKLAKPKTSTPPLGVLELINREQIILFSNKVQKQSYHLGKIVQNFLQLKFEKMTLMSLGLETLIFRKEKLLYKLKNLSLTNCTNFMLVEH